MRLATLVAEWMLNPGEHNFLDGLAAKEGVIKSRGFKNEKGSNKPAAPEQPVDPAVQAEMEELQRKHDELRGPSLMDAHRAKVQAAKEEKANEVRVCEERSDELIYIGVHGQYNNLCVTSPCILDIVVHNVAMYTGYRCTCPILYTATLF